jgi:hypothetical protein
MDVAEWQTRLERNFTANGVVGGQLFDVFDLEKSAGELYANTFRGQCTLIDSFQGFYIETLRTAAKWISIHGWPKNCPDYFLVFLYYVIIFRSFRACEVLLVKGYPLDGYSLFRDLKDRAIFLAAIAHNITTFTRIFGYGGNQKLDEAEYKRNKTERKREEYRVLDLMIRGNSGLPVEIISELDKWEQLFHEEVHGSRFSFFTELGQWIETGNLPSIGPTIDIDSITMYMNRSTEIGWLIVRLLPYLQPEEDAFGTEWKKKQQILDESFRYSQEGLSNLGKKIGDAFITFVDRKLTFPDPFFYKGPCMTEQGS